MQGFETAGPTIPSPFSILATLELLPGAGKSRSLSGPIGSDSTQTRLEFDATDNSLALAARACKAVRSGPAQCQSC